MRTPRIIAAGLLLTALAGVAPLATAAAPANDAFDDATVVAALPFDDEGATWDATTETAEPAPCGGIGATVWYTFTPSADSVLQAHTRGSGYDTVLAAYVGPDLASLQALACNDDAAGLSPQSRVTVTATAGVPVHFQVGGFFGKAGDFDFTLETPPPNDAFSDAVAIAATPFDASQSTRGGSLEAGEARPCAGIGSTVWYAFASAERRVLDVHTTDSDYDTAVAVWSGTDLEALELVECDDDGGVGLTSDVRFVAEAGAVYRLQVGGFQAASGRLELHVDVLEPPANDDFADAKPLGPAAAVDSLNTENATRERGEPGATCAPAGATVWYRLPVLAGGVVEADTLGSDFDTFVQVWDGAALGDLAPVTCSDELGDAAGNPVWLGVSGSAVQFRAEAGHTYYFQVGGYFGATGNLVFRAAFAGA